jgi:hypothetical protein
MQPTTPINDQQPTSYTDRLLEYLESKQDHFTIDELREYLNGFKQQEYEKKLERADIVPVGKYRYKKVKEVAAFDKQYIQWMLKQSWIDKYPAFITECNKYI